MAVSKHSKLADQADESKADSAFEAQLDKTVDSIESKQFTTAQLETIHQCWADIQNDLSSQLSHVPLEIRNKHWNLDSIVNNYLEYLQVHYEAMTEEMHRLISILKPKHQIPSNPPPVTVGGTWELMNSLRLVIYHARQATDSLNKLIDKIEMQESERLEWKRENMKLFLEASEKTMEVFKAESA